jgi:hypothetical protein
MTGLGKAIDRMYFNTVSTIRGEKDGKNSARALSSFCINLSV